MPNTFRPVLSAFSASSGHRSVLKSKVNSNYLGRGESEREAGGRNAILFALICSVLFNSLA